MKKNHSSFGIYFVGSIVIILISISILWAHVSKSLLAKTLPFIIIVIIVLIFVFIVKIEDIKDKKQIVYHNTFGKMKYNGYYWSVDKKISLMLWDKTYNVSIEIGSNSINNSITEAQESICEDTIKTIIEKRTKIEKLIEDYYFEQNDIDGETLIRNADIHTIIVEESGISCISGGAIEDDEHDGFYMVIKPKLEIMMFEDYWDYKRSNENA